MENIPVLSADLIQSLDESYPTPVIRPGVDRDTLMYEAGQRQVVDKLLHLMKEN